VNCEELSAVEAGVCVWLVVLAVQRNSSSLMSFSPGSFMMAGGDGLHDDAGRKRELRLLKNK